MIHPQVDYQKKNRFVETGVEEGLRYFDDTNFFLQSELRAELMILRK
jgi:hypothetical protein